ncbi:hypothetical protein BGW39_006882 [Mortierella sp. 14UC]|nr:hypothetical protein BGW39_006882 [Mortierella sp. 14UC]
MLIFILLRVTTTRGFAALKPGFNTRAIVTWLSCTSLTLMVLYNAILARTLYTESMGAYYYAPAFANRSSLSPDFFPMKPNVTFRDLSHDATWKVDAMDTPEGQQIYHILAMKPSVLYSDENLYYQTCLRIVLKAAQSGLMASLLLLNTYWCSHVEALVDEGNFMSKTEKYLYYILSAIAAVVPVTVLSVLSLGFNDMKRGGNISDLLLLICGVAVMMAYVATCRRLRALERDSRNVNGKDTSITLQLSYYIYCIYWLIGSMVFIFTLGVMYRYDEDILKPQCNPVKAQIISDLEGATWSTVLIMVYPAAMFLLYPSVDVLTKPENDPAPHFQKRVRRVVKDPKHFRESLYIDGESGSGINGVSAQHSSLHGLTTNSGLALQPLDNGQAQSDQAQQQQSAQQAQQRYSYIEPKRRDRMDSLTAVANEMHMIEQANAHASSSKGRDPSTPSRSQEPSPDDSKQESWSGAPKDQDLERGAYRAKADNNSSNNNGNLAVGLSRRDSSSPSNYYDDSRDVETMKKWLAQNGDVDQDNIIAGLERTIDQQHQSWNFVPATPPKVTTTPASPEIASAARPPSGEKYAMSSTAPSSGNNNNSGSSSASPVRASGTPGKPAAAPLTGILKTRNSTSSTRSSFGQNPFEQHAANIGTPVYGVRTSSVQPQNQTGPGSRKSSENLPVKRRASNSNSSPAKSNTAVTGPSPILISAESPSASPSSQQRRSNVTTRMDAGALAIAAHQHQQQQQQQTQKGRTSRDGGEVDYFGLRKTSFEVHSTATSPPPLPYEPQGQNVPPLDMIMSPTMTGFLMADPYPSAGTRYLDGDEPLDFSLSSDSQDDTKTDELQQQGRRSSGSTGGGSGTTTPSSKRYKAPPPPIPTDIANTYASHSRRPDGGGFSDTYPMPVTPTTPITPPGVRPRRSVDNVVDKQFLEMAKLMYEDHEVLEHILHNALSTPVSPTSIPLPATTTSTARTTTVSAPTTPTTASSPPPPLPPSPQQPLPLLHTSASSPTFYGPFSMVTNRTPPPPSTPPPRSRHENPPPFFTSPPASPSRPRHEDPLPIFTSPPPSQPLPQTTQPQVVSSPTRHEPQALYLPELPQRIPITPSPLQRVMTPPAKSPYRVRESFETRMAAHSHPTNNTPSTATITTTTTATSSVAGGTIQGPSAPSSPTSAPSVASTTSPTILSATTLPRPLTPAWYETKTNFASTNDVLNHYNAVTRGGSYHKQQQQQQQKEAEERMMIQQSQFQSAVGIVGVPQQQQVQQLQLQQQQPYYLQPSVGPLDEVPSSPPAGPTTGYHQQGYYQQQHQGAPQAQKQLFCQEPPPVSSPLSPSRPQNNPSDSELPSSLTAQQQQQQQQQRTPSLEPRTGSTDSFGVYRRRSSSAQLRHQQQQSQLRHRSKDELDLLPIASANQLQQGDPNLYPIPSQHQHHQQQQQGLLQLDRHSFIMPSESISVYSTWTGDLSDVTNTSGEVSVGAFLDRKQASTLQYHRRKSGEKPGSHLSNSSIGTINQALHHSGSGSGSRDSAGNRGSGSGGGGSGAEDMRKSQYSLGSFGSRQSAGAYSNYSNHSSGSGSGPVSGPLSEAFGSGPVVVSASLSSVGQPTSSHQSTITPGTPGTNVVAPGGGGEGVTDKF